MSGGGSGGHITPLLSLAHELKDLSPDCQITYIGHKGDDFDSLHLPAHDFDFLAFINGGKFRRYHGESFLSHLSDVRTLALNVRDIFRVIKAVGGAYRILSRVQADVLFAKGGFVSVPVGLAARLKGIPIITHDSDAVGGLANRIVGRWAVVKATGMPTKFYKKGKARSVYVGIPLADNIRAVTPAEQEDYKKSLGLGNKDKLLLVVGGSLGSQRLNDLVATASTRLLQADESLRIIHVAGRSHLADVQAAYQDKLDDDKLRRVECLDFVADFYRYAGAADLIISRAGATAIAEFALLVKTCIIIPSPFLAGGHQLKNAQELADQDAAVVLAEDTQSDELVGVVNHLLNDPDRRHQLAANLGRLAKPGAARALARIIIQQAEDEG